MSTERDDHLEAEKECGVKEVDALVLGKRKGVRTFIYQDYFS